MLMLTAEAKANASASPSASTPKAVAPPSIASIESVTAPMRQISIATKADVVPIPEAVVAASEPRASRAADRTEEARQQLESSPGPSEEEEISYEEAKRRADERAEAALQCSIDNKEACLMCSG